MHRILIADHDARMRRIVGQIIAPFASEIYEASSRDEAMEVTITKRPDWALVDLQLSPVNGFAILLQVKAALPQTRVIILSEYDDPCLRAKALRTGASAYLLKENLQELPAILAGLPPEVLDAARSVQYPNAQVARHSHPGHGQQAS